MKCVTFSNMRIEKKAIMQSQIVLGFNNSDQQLY